MASTAQNLTFSVHDLPPAASAHLRVPPGPEICEDCERRRKRDARKESNSAWKLRALRGFAESSSQRALTHSCCTRNEGFINPCWALPPQSLRVLREGLFEIRSSLIHYCLNDPEPLEFSCLSSSNLSFLRMRHVGGFILHIIFVSLLLLSPSQVGPHLCPIVLFIRCCPWF